MLNKDIQLSPTFKRPTFWLAALAIFHFGVGCFAWVVFGVRQQLTAAEWLGFGFIPLVIECVLLLLASIACLAIDVKWPRIGRWLVIALYAVSLGLFAYDLANGRSQFQIDIATAKYLEIHGRQKYFYLTWWWYKDSWFRFGISKPTLQILALAAIGIVVVLYVVRRILLDLRRRASGPE